MVPALSVNTSSEEWGRGAPELGGVETAGREIDLLECSSLESSLSAWEPGQEAGLISCGLERGGNIFLVVDYTFPEVFELTPASFHTIRAVLLSIVSQWFLL